MSSALLDSPNVGLVSAFGVGFVLVVSWQWFRSIFLANLPPGPTPLPIFGNLLSIPIADKPDGLMKMAKKYGDLIYFHGLGQKILVISNRRACQELMVRRHEVTSGRPVLPMCGELCGYNKSIVLRQPSKEFREMRREINLAVGKGRTRERPLPEKEVAFYLKKLLDNPDDCLSHNRWLMGAFTLNLAYGYRPKPEGDTFVAESESAIREFAELVEPGAWIVDFIPLLRYVPAWFPGARFKRDAVKYHQSTLNLSIKPWNMVKKQLKEGNAPPSLCADLIMKNQDRALTYEDELYLAWTAGNVYAGGSDTSVSTLGSFFMAMTFFPEVKAKATAEVDAFVKSKERLPTVEDRAEFPYVAAMISELYRWGIVAPLGIPHCTTEDVVYKGRVIPKGTAILTNIWAMSRDEEFYSSPYDFRPERFLGPDKPQDPREFTFGSGRRMCPGIDMADAMLMAAIPAVLATLDIRRCAETPAEPGWMDRMARHPKPFKCTIELRSQRAMDLIEDALRN